MTTAHFLVPTARLELAQLAPLPPQDSVSTNFTTSALLFLLLTREVHSSQITTFTSVFLLLLNLYQPAPMQHQNQKTSLA